MKVLIIALLFLGLSQEASASCVCQGQLAGTDLPKFSAPNESRCFQHLIQAISHKKLLINSCQKGQDRKFFAWSCTKAGKKLHRKNFNFSCKRPVAQVAELLASSLINVSSILQGTSPGCRKNRVSLKPAAKTPEKISKIRFKLKNKDQALKLLEKFTPGKVFDRSKDKWNLKLSFTNDNKAYGLFDSLFSNDNSQGSGGGDDMGNTHGMEFSIGKALNNEYYLTLEYSSHLYTAYANKGNSSSYFNSLSKPAKNNLNNQKTNTLGINFLEENLFQFILDNKNSNNMSYHKVGIGWHSLNEDKLGERLLSAANQQKRFHEFINNHGGDVPTYNYIPGGRVDSGLYLSAAKGLSSTLYQTDRTRVTGEAEIGGALSTADSGANNINAKTKLTLDYQPNANSLAVRASYEANSHAYIKNREVINQHKFSIEMGRDKVFCGASLTARKSDHGASYKKYDNDRDPILGLHCNWDM